MPSPTNPKRSFSRPLWLVRRGYGIEARRIAELSRRDPPTASRVWFARVRALRIGNATTAAVQSFLMQLNTTRQAESVGDWAPNGTKTLVTRNQRIERRAFSASSRRY